MKTYTRVARAITSEPWAVTPNYLEIVESVVERACGTPNAEVTEQVFKRGKQEMALKVMNGIPVVPIIGVISRRMNLFSEISGGTSIEKLDMLFAEAMKMPGNTIILQMDSPGGSASGVPEFADKVYRAAQNSGKTIVTCVEGMMCSAGYWIGSQSDEIYATKASDIGSIGVICSFFDPTRAYQNEGYDPVTIRSTELKAAGSGSVTPNQMAWLKKRVDELYGMFKNDVSRGRPGIDIEAVATGETWLGQDAKRLGLIDGIATLEHVVEKYSGKIV